MLTSAGVEQVYLACGSTDLRKSINGLSVLVSQAFSLDPFAPALFVFCNRQRDKIKTLYWQHNGFGLYYRRLERGRFQWRARLYDRLHHHLLTQKCCKPTKPGCKS